MVDEENISRRFVVLVHDHPFLHWDLMLEWGSVLRCWRLLEEPKGGWVAAQAIGDHRPMYLDYEGPVSNGRGHVWRWDAGDYRIERDEHGSLLLRLRGKKINCLAVLICVQGDEWKFFSDNG